MVYKDIKLRPRANGTVYDLIPEVTDNGVMKPRPIGMGITGDIVKDPPSGGLSPIPFTKILPGFVGANEYCQMQPDGTAKILKAGLYRVHTWVTISDPTAGETGYLSIDVNGGLQSENSLARTNNRLDRTQRALVRCNVNDSIRIRINCVRHDGSTVWWRVDQGAKLYIAPVCYYTYTY